MALNFSEIIWASVFAIFPRRSSVPTAINSATILILLFAALRAAEAFSFR
jgi:hypothetical protein